ncbi:MAG TPA: M56 family metallopeptidase [Acidobacteriaceae bacterium]|nr:M56 family metallopeptidase [Acidobacteriaceae bacterium]
MMTFAQLAVERVLNSLPEGLLIAVCAWLLLRVMGRQNSGTRFAVWLVALASVVTLPFVRSLGSTHDNLSALLPQAHPEISISVFWASAFFVLWSLIATVALARVAAGLWQVRQIRRSCIEIPAADLDPEFAALLSDSKRPVRLLVSEKARVPAALGFRKPAIVLPAWALSELSTDDLRPILIHELAHLRRRDDWTNLLQKTIRALLFFHPAVWWIDARLSLEREMACDDAVLAATGNPRAYAGCLIDLLEKGCARRGWSMAQAAVAHARDASIRIARILRVGPAVNTRVGRVALSAAASLSLVCTAIALCAPQFVEFVPLQSASTAQLNEPLVDNVSFAPSHSAVVPATFHPNQKPASAHRPVAKRTRSAHAAPLRQASLTSKHPVQNPVVLAKVTEFTTTTEPAPVPVMIVLRSTESATAGPAQLRPTGASPSDSNVRILQSTENPALQIQIVQIVDPATGMPTQILRIILVVPQQPGSPSQSI